MSKSTNSFSQAVSAYFTKCLKYSGASEHTVDYLYSSYVGKRGFNSLFIKKLSEECTAYEFMLYILIASSVPITSDPFKSGVVELNYQDYSYCCSRSVFARAKKKFIEQGYLLQTPKSRFYIINPKYVNNFKKLKFKKK